MNKKKTYKVKRILNKRKTKKGGSYNKENESTDSSKKVNDDAVLESLLALSSDVRERPYGFT